MVHVDLENLLLGQQAFDLQRKQHLVDFASKCFLGRQIEIARDLHRDRRCALGAARLAEVGQAGADHAHVVDAAVLVELRVLGGEHRVLHHLRDLADRHEVAPLLAELAQQHAVGGEHAHRQLRPVVGEAADLGQVGIGRRRARCRPPEPPRRPLAAARPNSPATMRSRTLAQEGSAVAERPLRAARPLSSLLDSLTRWPASRAHYRNRCRSDDPRGLRERSLEGPRERAKSGVPQPLSQAFDSARLRV